jgi:hypothetical protein
LIDLVTLGRKIGLQDGNCPLCAKGQSHVEFDHGRAIAEAIARRLDEEAREAEWEQARRSAEVRIQDAQRAAEQADSAHRTALNMVEEFDREMLKQGFDDQSSLEILTARIRESQQAIASAQRDLRIVDTLRLSASFEQAQRSRSDARFRLARAQERFGRARKAEAAARALYDGARRAAGETLDQRLDRVLPLMSELYCRLRPHPIWRNIEYSIRGDVKRFLKLQVGEGLNPQFLFSSGQRRAAGLAFLLSVNISLAWSRWRSVLLNSTAVAKAVAAKQAIAHPRNRATLLSFSVSRRKCRTRSVAKCAGDHRMAHKSLTPCMRKRPDAPQ